jgi:hypothetical protein
MRSWRAKPEPKSKSDGNIITVGDNDALVEDGMFKL